MADPATTDVFKFLAVRPPQLRSEQETSQSIIRDPRANDEAGAADLRSLASDLVRPEAALARWHELDLTGLAPLVEAYRAIVARYQNPPSDSPPDALALLEEAGLGDLASDTRLLRTAWDALYVANSIGPAAGKRLPAPMAALRIFHFAKLVDQDKVSTVATALTALHATPALPSVFHETRIGALSSPASAPATPAPSAPDVDVSGRIIPLGIGDLKVVKQTLLAYVPGEVAHIENVLKGEKRERKHRKLDRTETTLFNSEEETKETERDTQSTDRFELKRESEATIKEDMSLKAGLSVTASYGPIVATATGDFAYSTSKQDSQKSSSNFAREVVERSVSKVQTKTKTERTTKTLNEVEEINTHGVTNTDPSAKHVVGIYRWVDKRYRAQVYNYGVRLLLEFIVPEPAAFYRRAQGQRVLKVRATPPPAFENSTGKALSIADITESTYESYASRYNTPAIAPPPPEVVYVGTTLAKDSGELGKSIGISTDKLVIPNDYTLAFYTVAASFVWGGGPQFTVVVGGMTHEFQNSPGGVGLQMSTSSSAVVLATFGMNGIVPVSVAAYDVTAFVVNVEAQCARTPESLKTWAAQTFDKIYAAYQALQTAYEQKVAQAEAVQGISIQGQNPAMNRVLEKTELKKLCITMMTGQHFSDFDAMTDPSDKTHFPELDVFEALKEGRIEQFFEQAFEWEQMTYLFYPYFWGRKTNWVEVAQLQDTDPLFAQFLSAGAARVVVPVPLAYADAVQFMLQEPGMDLGKKVWRGGERPTIEDEDGLYVSITEELRDQTDDLAGAVPEGTSWEFTVPTTLVWLQADAALPTFE